MKPITSLISPEELEELASRSNFRYGKSLAKDADIKFTKVNTFNLTAEVRHKGGEARVAELMSTPKGLRWKCSCSNRKDLFCEHCVAAGLAWHAKLLQERK